MEAVSMHIADKKLSPINPSLLQTEAGQREGFATLLHQGSAATLLQQVSAVSLIENEGLFDSESIASFLSGLLEENETLWQEGMLNHEAAEELTELLPVHLQEEIEMFFNSLESQVLTQNALTVEAVPAALLLAVSHHQSSGSMKEMTNEKLSTLINSVKTLLEGETAAGKSILAMADKLQKNIETLLPAEEKVLDYQVSQKLLKQQKVILASLQRQSQPFSSYNVGMPVFQQGTLTAAEQLAIQLPAGNKFSDTQFLREFQSILHKGKMVALSGGISSITLKLNPENLGSISIEIIQKNGELTAKITAATFAAKEAIDSQLGTLKNALSSQKVMLEQIDVFVQEKNSMFYKDQGGSKEPHQDAKQQRRFDDENGDQDNVDFSAVLDLLNERV